MTRKRRGSTRRPTSVAGAPTPERVRDERVRPRARPATSSRSPWPMALVLGAVVVGLVAVVAVARPFGIGGGSGSSAGDPAGSGPAGSGAAGSGAAGSGGGGSGPAGSGACPTSQPPALPAGEHRTVTIETAIGTITMRLDADLSPIAVGNFVALASCGYYDGVGFHRVVPGFVIQGGDPSGSGSGGPGYTIQDEPVTATYRRGTVAMARTPRPNSVGSQFFIVLDDKARGSLERANTYQILGEVTGGMEVADAIAAAADAENPSNPVTMTRVSVTNP